MIVVKIELWPAGDASRAKELYRMVINRTRGSITDINRDYRVRLLRKGKTAYYLPKNVLREGKIEDWSTKKNVYLLVAEAINKAWGKK